MLTKLRDFNKKQGLICPGDRIVCAVSGGPDSMALLWAMYLLKDEWGIILSAAHFNHGLRGAESDRDEQFVRDFCAGYGIPLTVGKTTVVSGPKGLEAAAREARYDFLRGLPGKIATAHNADDNAETVLMHLVRGTGLKGLGGITPSSDHIIRPLLSATRQEIEAFLEEYSVPSVQDSSNSSDDFLRNRLRHHIMPFLCRENPRFSENLSATALRLRLDEEALSSLSEIPFPPCVDDLRVMAPALRARALDRFLKDCGVREPEAEHIAMAEALVFSENPSAKACFPGGVIVTRCYDTLEVFRPREVLDPQVLAPGSEFTVGGFRICCREADTLTRTVSDFTVFPRGVIVIRSRQPGDAITLSGGTRSLKKLFIDRRIPASLRDSIPVLADDDGILAVCGIGADLSRIAHRLPALRIQISPVLSSKS